MKSLGSTLFILGVLAFGLNYMKSSDGLFYIFGKTVSTLCPKVCFIG